MGREPPGGSGAPLVSLVLATVGREQEVREFLASLQAQTYRNFELFLVDQNPDERLLPILDAYRPLFPLYHLRSPRGLSRARNRALPELHGSLVGFPDDDCLYPEDLLERVVHFLNEHAEYAGVSGTVRFLGGRGLGRFQGKAGVITPANIWFRVTSFTLFLRREVLSATGGFPEHLGIGTHTPWGSSEEIALALKAMQLGFRLFYEPRIFVYHPFQLQQGFRAAWQRGIRYGGGIGRVLAEYGYPRPYQGYHLLRSLGGVLVHLVRGRFPEAIYHGGAFLGKLRGLLSSPSFLPSPSQREGGTPESRLG